jgi:hypothetical protein
MSEASSKTRWTIVQEQLLGQAKQGELQLTKALHEPDLGAALYWNGRVASLYLALRVLEGSAPEEWVLTSESGPIPHD